MRNLVTLPLAAMALALVPVACRSRGSEADLKALNTLQRQVDSAIKAGDTESYVRLIADDAVLMPPNAPPVIGKDAIRSWNEMMARQFRFQSYRPVDEEVVVSGKWAFRRATADWTLAPVGGGAPISDSGKFIIIYERQPDGSWRVARDIWNSNTVTR